MPGSLIHGALLCADIRQLSNNEIGRRLGVSGHFVGEHRNLMERRGLIPRVMVRLGSRGYVDVRNIGAVVRKNA